MVALRQQYELVCRSLSLKLLEQTLHFELQRGIHDFCQPNPAQTLKTMSIIVKLIRIIVKKQQNMLSGCHSACLPADPDAFMFLALLWPVKPLCTGPGICWRIRQLDRQVWRRGQRWRGLSSPPPSTVARLIFLAWPPLCLD